MYFFSKQNLLFIFPKKKLTKKILTKKRTKEWRADGNLGRSRREVYVVEAKKKLDKKWREKEENKLSN